MVVNHLNKINDYKAYTILIIGKYNDLLFNINKNYRDYVRLDAKTARAWMVSQNHNFTFEYVTLQFYSLQDKTLSPVGRILSNSQEDFIQCLINILERTDILNQHAKNDAGFIASDVAKEHIRYIDEHIQKVKNMMIKLTIANRFLKK